ncbi:MAG: hypothetical protein IKX56_05970 [Muribaculaceae bacterium]|nr:hypothetical protein [Muribaculaceae bacterium]
MKKYFYMAALLIATALTMSSCGSDEPNEKVTATTTYSISFSQDLLEAANVFITFKAENGRNVMEAVTSTWWSKTVTSDKFPAEFGVMYKFSTKSDAELSKEKYDLTCKLNFNGRTSKGASYTNEVTLFDAKGVAKNKVVSTLEKYSGKSTGFRVTKDGIYSSANNLNYD